MRNGKTWLLAPEAAPDTKTKRAALDEFMWSYHDQRHTGDYTRCDGCTQVWMFFTDNPKFNIL
jgi:hypothetical protein